MKLAKKMISIALLSIVLIVIIATIIIQVKNGSKIDDAMLLKPQVVTMDLSANKQATKKMVRAAQLYYTFWDTGQYKYLDAALAPEFIDHDYPKNRPQGAEGMKAISNDLRSAIPDLSCSIEELVIAGNMVTARLHFKGVSKGTFMGYPATGKPVEFNAIDMLRIQNNQIVEEWHVQDDLALLEQLNIVKVIQK